MPLFEMTDQSFRPVPEKSFTDMGIGERSDIQRLLRTQIEVLGDDLYVLSEEFAEWEDSRRRIDLLAIDKEARLVVIELKRTQDGGHMELQAIRYASMVARMTFARAVEIHEAFLGRMGQPPGDARGRMLSFLGWAEPMEDRFAGDVRIVLVSEGFSKELTTAVLWLRDRDIDIRCIQLQPYRSDGKTLIDVRQVIPLPEAQDYMIRIREKEQQERRSRAARFSEESQQACLDYWQGVLAELEPSGILEPGMRPHRKEHIRFNVGWPDFHLKAFFSRASPKAGVWVTCRGDDGFANYEALKAHGAEIERALGQAIEWTDQEDDDRGTIFVPLPGIDATDRPDWPRQHRTIAQTVLHLQRALKPFVEPLLRGRPEGETEE